MKKYLAKRIAFSVFSLLVVVLTVMVLVYSLIERSVIFQTDDTWNKRSNNDRTYYEYSQYQKYGYVDMSNFTSFLAQKYADVPNYTEDPSFKADRAVIQDPAKYEKNASVKEFIEKYTADGYEIKYLKPILFQNGSPKPGGSGYLLAVRERSMLARLGDYLKGLVTVETVNDVQDPTITERYVRWEKDPYSGFYARVGMGTNHKYQLYFDSRFPFIHQNKFHLNLGVSYTRFRGQQIVSVINQPRGNMKVTSQQFPAKLGTDEYADTAIDFHSLTWNYSELTADEKLNYPDKYTVATFRHGGLSMLENSFVIGLIATVLAYILGLPLGILVARRKDSWIDKLGMGAIIFFMAVPSLAYIFLFAAAGTRLFGLPYKFATAKVMALAYILPTISLAIPQTLSLMKWMRRYMIDQMNSDYVKFARAEGLSEQEIFRQHISRNAAIPIVHGIPASVLGCLTGAIITERVYAVPGVGSLLTNAINSHDNGIIIACTVFYTSLSVISLILGDLLMAKVDPRISFEEKAGR